jgi:hypothetical protein
LGVVFLVALFLIVRYAQSGPRAKRADQHMERVEQQLERIAILFNKTTPPDETPPPDKCKLTHRDEYETLHSQVMLYQREIHRTWLWAVIAAAAVYTWLTLHENEMINLPKFFFFIPPFLIAFCFLRYFHFRERIRIISLYLDGLEKDAFGKETNEDLRGIGHFAKKFTSRDKASYVCTFIFWLFLIGLSVYYFNCLLQKAALIERGASQHDIGHQNTSCH